MKERGLVLGTLDLRAKSRSGEKTNTRRIVRLHKNHQEPTTIRRYVGNLWEANDIKYNSIIKSQYQAGDHLYLQEPYQILDTGSYKWIHGRYVDDDKKFSMYLPPADWEKFISRKTFKRADYPFPVNSSRFMYKSLARTWFEVTEVRVERLQEISKADVLSEGVDESAIEKYRRFFHPDDCPGLAFKEFWDSTNKIKWADNPWVFVYVFKQMTGEDRRGVK